MTAKKQQQIDYLLECIRNCSINIDRDDTPKNDSEAITNVYNNILGYFKGFKNGYIRTFREAIQEFVEGMGINTIDCYNSQIISIGRSWGYCQTERKAENFMLNWWSCTANNLMHIFENNGNNVYIYWTELL